MPSADDGVPSFQETIIATDRVVAVGPLHGCARQLEEILDRGRAFDDHRWVFLGSYLGPDAERVLQRLRRLDAVFLRGRAEDELLSAWAAAVTLADRRRWLDATGLSAASVEWLAEVSLPLSETEVALSHGFVHTEGLVASPLVEGRRISLDTGCGRGGPLTAVALPELIFFQSSPSPQPPRVEASSEVALAEDDLEEL